jgi:F-type H+-transporting ATPase subunit gamma
VANLRDIRRRIGSVKNTRQITSAMKLVATSKMGRAVERATAAKPYGAAIKRVLGRVAEKAGGAIEHPLLTAHDEVKTVQLVVFTSDRGLCGGFNNNLLRQVHRFIQEQEEQGKQVVIRTFGKKARAFCVARDIEVQESLIEVGPAIFMERTMDLAGHLTAGFNNGEFHEAYLAYNEFRSAVSQVPTFTRVLPLTVEASEAQADAGGADVDYEYEPSAGDVLNSLLPLYLQTIIHQVFLEQEAGEHAARMAAMDNATRNASDLIGELTLQYNRARQAAITTELIEIVSGAAAL